MACRIPVLATDCPSGPREILEDGRLGRLVAPANAAALADAIHDALDNREKWLAIVPAARKRIEEDFSPSNGIARLEQLLKEVASGASHSR
jgi:glycosyltransferase involved in cell wall biosynthesis